MSVATESETTLYSYGLRGPTLRLVQVSGGGGGAGGGGPEAFTTGGVQ